MFLFLNKSEKTATYQNNTINNVGIIKVKFHVKINHNNITTGAINNVDANLYHIFFSRTIHHTHSHNMYIK
jgi:hypothetical protein